jgi:phosphotransferase system enzyme I (PtsI)
MTFAVHGLPVARGIAIGRAVLVVSSRIDVAHYFIKPEEIDTEIDRVRTARNAVADELIKLQANVALMGPNDAPHELSALLEVHQMLLQDEALSTGVKHWISERLYNAEWALTTQLEIIARQFDEMEDAYLRERKADLEQVVERLLHRMKGTAAVLAPSPPRRKRAAAPWTTTTTTTTPPRATASTCRWCSSRTTCRRPTCCSSRRACSPAS